jgi:hypothetical protein
MADTIDELMHRHYEAEQHLRAELLAQEDVVRDLQQQLQLVRKQHDEKMECIDQLNLSLAELTSQFQHEEVIAQLERQLQSTKQQLAQTANDLGRTEAGKGKDAARARQQQQVLNLAQAQVHEAVGAVQLVQERCFRKLDCLAHELAAYQASVDDSTSSRLVAWRQCLKEEVAAKEAALAKLQEMQRRLEEERAATHEAESQHAFSCATLAKLEKEVAEAQRRLEDERAANASLEKEALHKLHTDIALLEEEVAETQRRLEQERAAKEAALSQYASSSAALAQLEEEVSAKEEVAQRQRRLEEERMAKEVALRQHESSSAAFAKLEEVVAEAQRRLEEERMAKEDAVSQHASSSATLANLEEELAQTQRRLEQERAAKEAALSQYASSSAALDAAQQELIRLDSRLEEERAANAERENEVHVDYM